MGTTEEAENREAALPPVFSVQFSDQAERKKATVEPVHEARKATKRSTPLTSRQQFMSLLDDHVVSFEKGKPLDGFLEP